MQFIIDRTLALLLWTLLLGFIARAATGVKLLVFVHYGFAALLLVLCGLALIRAGTIGRRHHPAFDEVLGNPPDGTTMGRLSSVLALVVALLLCSIIAGAFGAVAWPVTIMYFMTLAEPIIAFVAVGLILRQKSSNTGRSHWVRYNCRPQARTTVGTVFTTLISIAVVVALGQLLGGRSGDSLKSILVDTGGGHHVFGGLMAGIALWTLVGTVAKDSGSKWRALPVLAISLAMAVATDSKQFLALMLLLAAAWATVSVLSRRSGLRTKMAVLAAAGAALSGGWYYLSAFAGQAQKALLGIAWKSDVLRELWREADVVNVLFGFGSGQTVSKLALVIDDYSSVLEAFGQSAYRSHITDAIWAANQAYWVSNTETGSSLFSQFFSWAGIVGDLGLIGALVYGAIIVQCLRTSRTSQASVLLLLYLFTSGFLFLWLEEPALTVPLAVLAGLGNARAHRIVAPPKTLVCRVPVTRQLADPRGTSDMAGPP